MTENSENDIIYIINILFSFIFRKERNTMATKSFDRNIVIKDPDSIKLIKQEMEKSEYSFFSTGKKIEVMSKDKVKNLAEKLLGNR